MEEDNNDEDFDNDHDNRDDNTGILFISQIEYFQLLLPDHEFIKPDFLRLSSFLVAKLLYNYKCSSECQV